MCAASLLFTFNKLSIEAGICICPAKSGNDMFIQPKLLRICEIGKFHGERILLNNSKENLFRTAKRSAGSWVCTLNYQTQSSWPPEAAVA